MCCLFILWLSPTFTHTKVCNRSNTAGASCGARTGSPSGAAENTTYYHKNEWQHIHCGHCLCIRFTASGYPLTPSSLYVYMHLIIYMLKLQRYNIGASSRLVWTARLHFNIKFQISLTNINCQYYTPPQEWMPTYTVH
jgi:hypothetical protein